MERRHWTNEEDDILRNLYGKVPANELHLHIPGRTKVSVSGRLGKLGIRRVKELPWTEAELAILRERYGRISPRKIAKELGRTPDAVHIKATRLKLHARKRRLTPRTIGQLMHICSKQVKRWIDKGWLKAEVVHKKPKTMHAVMIDDLVECLKAHPEAWDARRCPDLHLKLGLKAKRSWGAADDRPIWLKDKLADDIRRGVSGKRWTKAEDVKLAQLLKRGLTYQQIGKQLGRPGTAVEHRIHRLGPKLWTLQKQLTA